MHLVACCYYKDARVHCEVLKLRAVLHSASREGGFMQSREISDPSGPNSVPESTHRPAEVPFYRSRCTDSVLYESSQIVDVH